MNSTLSLSLAAATGAAITVMALQFFGTPTQTTTAAISAATLDFSDCSTQINRFSSSGKLAKQNANIQPESRTQQEQTVNSVNEQKNTSLQPKAYELPEAELQVLTLQHTIAPYIANLKAVLQLSSQQQQQLATLATQKAEADLQEWQAQRQQLAAGNPDVNVLDQRYRDVLQRNSEHYVRSVQALLSAQQYKAYVDHELSLVEQQKQLQISNIASRLRHVNGIDEFQLQEATRLSTKLFSTTNKILPGATASPFASGLISTDPEVLQQLSSVLSQEQLQQVGIY